MILAEAVRSAAREIRVHKVRSLLSFSAISVGAASLLYTLAQTSGMQRAMARNLEMMGPGALLVQPGGHGEKRGLSPGLTVQDADAIRSQFPELYMVAPTAQSWGESVFFEGRRIEYPEILGITTDWRRREWVYTLRGRFIDDRDVREAARVCVVVEPGGWVKKPFWLNFWGWKPPFDDLVARHDLLGRYLRIGDHDFRVVGALKLPPHDRDPRWRSWNNPSVIMPLSSFGRYVGRPRGPDAVDAIKIDTGDEKTLPAEKRRIEALVKARHRGEDDFEVKNMREDLEAAMKERGKYIAVALALGIVALVSGGIGILNVTLAAVYSRVKEIGIRRALGAGKGDIMALFLAESALLGMAGGVAGVALGIVLIDKIARAADQRGRIGEVTWTHALAMVALSSAVAAAFAAYPAWRASRLDPLEALRDEA